MSCFAAAVLLAALVALVMYALIRSRSQGDSRPEITDEDGNLP
jgi:hypothetical protein